jgi:flagellar protein FliO/FliZ
LRKLQLLVCVVLLFIMVSAGASTALAGMNSVDDWYEEPEKQDGEKKVDPSSAKDKPIGNQAPAVTFFDYVKMIAALIFVVALIYFLLKFINQKSRSFQQTKMINHLGGAPLGGNRSVQIVKIGNQVLVLGVGEDIQLLKEVQDEKEKEEILSYYNSGTEELKDSKMLFANLLNKVRGGHTNTAHPSDFQTHLKTQLEEMSKGRKRMLKDLKGKENHTDE